MMFKSNGCRINVLVVISFLLSACSVDSELDKNKEIDDNKSIAERVKSTPGLVSNHIIKQPNYQLHYVASTSLLSESLDSEIQNVNINQYKTSLVFVHGTPGSWGTFARYFEDASLRENFRVYSIDRPGWGESGYPEGDFPITLSDQSLLIEPILKEIWQSNNQQKIIMIGHSLGGSLVPKLAADYPNYVKGVIVLAGDLDPVLSEARWFNDVLDWVPDFLLPDMWMNSNNEVLAIRPSLENLQAEFATITMPIAVLQGTDDTLVRPGSAAKAPEIFKSSNVDVVMLEGASHIINLTHVSDVKKAIYNMDQKTKESFLK